MKRSVAFCLLTSAFCLGAASSHAQDYPVKPLRIVVPLAPGGGNDTTARLIGARLAASMGQPVIVENRPGAAGVIASEIVAKAPADGYTLYLVSTSFTSAPALVRKLPYDPVNDFAPVTRLAVVPGALIVHASLPVRSVKEFVALARARPKEITFGSAGIGSGSHFGGELFRIHARVDVTHVPYKGSALVTTALLSGEVTCAFTNPISSAPHVRAGRIRNLGVGSTERWPLFPEYPTIAESGVKGYEQLIWNGISVRTGTPPAILERLHGELVKAAALPEVVKHMAADGSRPMTQSPADFGAFIRGEIAKWERVADAAGLRGQLTMKAMVLHGGRDLRRETVPDPAPAPSEAVVEVRACSICGSDLHAYHGKHPRFTFPRVLGHEFAGEIVALGSAVRRFRVGQRVCCDIDFPCGNCGPCREGRGNICERLRTMGFDRDGAYADYAAVPDFNLHLLPDSVSYDQASAVQVLGISYHAIADRVKPARGERVAVIGAGPIGLGVALIARSMGAEVTILDLLDYRLALAQDLGIPHALNPDAGDLRTRALAATGGQGFDKVVECVGGFQERTVADAAAIVKRGGQITVVGTFPENRATIPIAYLKDREIDFNFSRGNFRAFPACIELIASGRVDPDRYISHRLPLEQAEDALKLLEGRNVEAHKIVLHPRAGARV